MTINNEVGLYLYSITKSVQNDTYLPIGMSESEEGSELSTVNYGQLSCVVSISPMKEWEISRKNVIQHQKVNEHILEENVVLPVCFGTMSKSSDEIIQKLLSPRSEELLERIEYFSDKKEFGLKVFWKDMDKTYSNLLQENDSLSVWRDKLSKLPVEQSRNDMVRLGQKVKESLENKRKQVEDILIEKLKPYVVECKDIQVVNDRQVSNLIFLVRDCQQDAFDTEINNISDLYEEELIFKYVGPAPPANFIEIKVTWE